VPVVNITGTQNKVFVTTFVFNLMPGYIVM